jgi:hypothetical protein
MRKNYLCIHHGDST